MLSHVSPAAENAAPQRLISALACSSLPTGTDSWGRLGRVARKARNAASEFFELGLGEPYPVSAIHGTGTGDLLDALVASLPAQEESVEDDSVKIAIVGKPNAGKSSLLNKLVGKQRAIVSPIPGTTRDAGRTWKWKAVTENSAADNLRPYVVRSIRNKHCVLWFRGSYRAYTDFETEIVGVLD